MNGSINSTVKSLIRGLEWLLFAMAALAFWVGGRAISEFANTERMLAEMEGIGLAMLFAGLGAILKTVEDRF
jgi:hypothetical protein